MKVWDTRKGGRESFLMSLDWQQDHTNHAEIESDTLQFKHKKRRLSTQSLREQNTSFRTVDWAKDSVARAHDAPIMGLKYAPCGNFIISSATDGKVRLWDAHDGALQPITYDIGCRVLCPHSMEIASFSSAADDVLIYPSATGEITFTHLHSSTGSTFHTLQGHLDMVLSLTVCPTTKQIISSSKDGLILLWDATQSEYVGDGTADEFDIKDCWTDDDDDNGFPMTTKTFLPPIIQQYLEDANRR